MAEDFRIILQGIVDESRTARNISDALKRIGNQATVKSVLDISTNKVNLDKEVSKVKSTFSKIGFDIDDKTAVKSINTVQKAYSNLRKEVYQSIGTKSPELQAMADYYKKAELEAEKLNKTQKDNNLKQQLNYYEKIKSEVKIIADLEKQLASLRSQQNAGKIPEDSVTEAEIKRQLKNANSRRKYNESQLDEKGLRDNSLEREVNNLSSSLADNNAIKERLATERAITAEREKQASIKTKLDNGSLDKQIFDIEKKFKKLGNFNGDITTQSNFSNQIKNIQELRVALATALNEGNNSKIFDTFNQLDTSIKKCKNGLSMIDQTVSALDRQTFSTIIDKWLKDNTKASNTFRNALMQIRNEAQSCDKVRFGELKKEFRNTTLEAEKLGQTGRSLFNELRNNATKFTQWFSVSQVIMQVTQEIKESVVELKEVDSILTEISKTSDLTSTQLKQLGNDSFDVASDYGKKAPDYLLGVQEMSRAGYKDANGMAELSTLAQSAGDMTAELANDYLIASDAAYGYKGNVEKLNALLDGQNQIN